MREGRQGVVRLKIIESLNKYELSTRRGSRSHDFWFLRSSILWSGSVRTIIIAKEACLQDFVFRHQIQFLKLFLLISFEFWNISIFCLAKYIHQYPSIYMWIILSTFNIWTSENFWRDILFFISWSWNIIATQSSQAKQFYQMAQFTKTKLFHLILRTISFCCIKCRFSYVENL